MKLTAHALTVLPAVLLLFQQIPVLGSSPDRDFKVSDRVPLPITKSHQSAAAFQKFEVLADQPSLGSLSQLNRAVQEHPHSPDVYLRRGTAYFNQDDQALAQADFDKALALDPKSARAHIGRARVFQAQGKFDLAFSELKKAAELGTPETAVNALWESAFLHRELQHYKIALAQFDTVVKSARGNNARRAMILFQRGEVHQRMGNLKPAEADFNASIRLNPNWRDVYYTRAQVYRITNRLPDALADYTKAISLTSSQLNEMEVGFASHLAEAYKERGQVYLAMGKRELAKRDFKSANEVDKIRFQSTPFWQK